MQERRKLFGPFNSKDDIYDYRNLRIVPIGSTPSNASQSPIDPCRLLSTPRRGMCHTDLICSMIHRSSVVPVPEEVSLRSESSSWTTARDPLSETSRDPSRLMTSWLFWSPRGRLGELTNLISPSRYAWYRICDDATELTDDILPWIYFSRLR